MNKTSACTARGGVWLEGSTFLTSYCAAGRSNTLSANPPTEWDLVQQRLADPAPSGFYDAEKLAKIVHNAKLRSHNLGVLDTLGLTSIGPLGQKVTWPIAPGDVIWKNSESVASGPDTERRIGVYIGEGMVVCMGPAIRAISPRDGRVYWKQHAPDPAERVRVVTLEQFGANGRSRCGVFNYKASAQYMDRMQAILLAAASVGVSLRRLVVPGAQHIAAYIRTGVWMIESPEGLDVRMIAPVSFSGTFSRLSQDETTPVMYDNSQCKIEFKNIADPRDLIQKPGMYTTFTTSTFSVVYITTSLAEELIRQKMAVQPFHVPLTGTFIAEDQVANILATAVHHTVDDEIL